MDVCGIFLGDTNLSYGSMRNSVYRDYEQFPYGTFENNKPPFIKDSYSKVQEKCQQIKIQKSGKQSCPFCKEHKKRPLISYLRKKNYQKNHEKICEEEEEEENENDEVHHHHDHHQNETESMLNCQKELNLPNDYNMKKNNQEV